jgi:hypothetical protein
MQSSTSDSKTLDTLILKAMRSQTQRRPGYTKPKAGQAGIALL